MRRYKLLGGLTIEEDGLPSEIMKSDRASAVLAYLIVTGTTQSREKIADLIWEADSTGKALKHLRQLLSLTLRGKVAELEIERKRLTFTAGPETVIDLYQLEEALASEDAQQIAAGLQLYQGDLLADFYLREAPRFNEWLLVAQERLRQRVYDAYRRLCDLYIEKQAWGALIETARRWVNLDDLAEEAHYSLIYGLAQEGQWQVALNRYQSYVQIMAAELDMPPSAHLVALYKEIRGSQREADTVADERTAADGEPPPRDYRKQAQMYVWGEAPRAEAFFGREEELGQLADWLTTDQANLVAILGIGGQGKTTLAATVARSLADQFDGVYWRSVINSPPLEIVLADFLAYLSQNQVLTPQELPEQLALTRRFLQKGRYLFVLDNLETVLDGQDTGRFQEEHAAYEQLLQLFGGGGHQSCLLLTSREIPEICTSLQQQAYRVCELQLGGLSAQAGLNLLAVNELESTAETLTSLTTRYSGNPLSLKLAAQMIEEFYFGDVAGFLQDEVLIFEDIRAVLNQQIGRLSPLELDIMLWLSITREATTPKELAALLLDDLNQRTLLEAMRRLQRRSLLERQKQGFVLQNVVMEYLTQYLVTHVVEEIAIGRFNLLVSHALMLAQSKEHVRQSQERIILQPLAQRLRLEFGTKEKIAHRVRALFALLRQNDQTRKSYAAGNLLNLLLYLNIDVTGYDLSELSVWQTNLKRKLLPAVNFSQADLSHSLFTEVFDLIYTTAFSPSGQVMAVGASNGFIQLWDTATQQQSGVFADHTGAIWSVTFSPDSRRLASAGSMGEIFIWDVEQQQVIAVLSDHQSGVHSLAFSPDGQTLASGSSDQTIRLWDVANGRTKHILTGHTNNVQAVAFSPDGRLLASGGRDNTVRLWLMAEIAEPTHDTPHQILRGHENWVYTLVFSPDGRTLASGGEDRHILLWDVPSLIHNEGVPVPHRRLSQHTAGIHSLAYSPDGAILASGGNDHTVRLWETDKGQQLQLLQGHTNWVRAVAFSPDGRLLASSGWDETVRLWQSSRVGWRPMKIIEGYSNWMYGVAFSPEGKLLASAHTDGRIRLWDVATNQLVQVLEGHTSWAFHVAFSPDGKQLASSSFDRTVRLWDTETWELRHVLRGHRDYVQGVCFNTDGTQIASGGLDGLIFLWDSATGKVIKRLDYHDHWICSVAFSPDGTYLASGSADCTAVLWNIEQEQIDHVLEGHTKGLQNVAFSPDGTYFATASWDNTVRIWHTAAGETSHILEGHTNWVQGVSFSPDGSLIATGGYDGTVRLWDVQSGKHLRLMKGHHDRVLFTLFSPDGQIVVGSTSDVLKVWNPFTGDCLRTWRPPGPYAGMVIDGVTGVGEVQRSALKRLGAVELADTQTAVGVPRAQANLPVLDALDEPGLLPSSSVVPYPRNDNFRGRQQDLLQLATYLLSPLRDSEGVRTAVITGFGGLGKTQLAVEFAFRYGRYYPGGVYWISFTDPDNVAEAIAAMGNERAMGLYQEADGLTLKDQISRVQRAWQEAIPRLLIFDNCESEAVFAKWRPVTGGCHVLVTSRRGRWNQGLGAFVLPLNMLERPDSVELLQHLTVRLSREEADAIAAEVGDYPLALHLAGSFLQRYQFVSTAAYLAQLRDKGLLDHPSLQGYGVTYSPTDHELHIVRTFAMNVEQLDLNEAVDQMAQRLLAAVNCFAPGEPLPQSLLLTILAGKDDLMASLLVQDGLLRLSSLGLLQVKGEEVVVLHRLLAVYVAEVLIAPELLDEVRHAVENSLIRLLSEYNAGVWGMATLPLGSAHLSYIVETARRRSDGQATALLTLWGCHQRDKGRFKEAEQYLKSAMELHQKLGSLNSGEGSEILSILGNLYIRMGSYTKAQSYFERHLEVLEQIPNATQLQVARSINQLGLAFMSQGVFGKAQQLLEESVAAYQAYYGTDWAHSDSRLMNLSVLHLQKGEYETSLALLKRDLRAVEFLFGSEHQEAALVLNYLGDVYFYLGDKEKAFNLNERALKIRQKTLGPKHLQTAFSLTSLGQMLLAEHKLTKAREYLEEALAIRERVQGKTHRLTAVCLHLLGELHLMQGEFKTARGYLEQGLAIRKQALGDDHPETAQSLLVLGEWYLAAEGDRKRAKALFEQARSVLAERVATTHVIYHRVQRNLDLMLTSVPIAGDLKK